jgi:hypothetical protein
MYKPLIGRLLIIWNFAVAASGTRLYALIGLLLLDLIGAYLVHLVEHKTKSYGVFILIHHTDTWIDTTTANRHHPGKCYSVYVYRDRSFTYWKSDVVGFPVPNLIRCGYTIQPC